MPILVTDLRVNGLTTALGIDTPHPEFSWKISDLGSSAIGTTDISYTIQVSTSPVFGDVQWESSQNLSSDEVFSARYSGAVTLKSRIRYFWRVTLWETAGNANDRYWPTTSHAWFEMGLLDPVDWVASWISPSGTGGLKDQTPIYVSGRWDLTMPITQARAYATACGWYKLFINGSPVTGTGQVPRWTPFETFTEYQCYDVTRHLQTGVNVISVAVGDGRFRGLLGINDGRARYGDRLCAMVQLEAIADDQSRIKFCTDSSWASYPGRILMSDPMAGEIVDMRRSDEDWLAGRDSKAVATRTCETVVVCTKALIAEEVERVEEVMALPCKSVTHPDSESQVLDFGQNISGVISLRLRGATGTRVSITYGEVLTRQGKLDMRYLMPFPLLPKAPPQRDIITLSGGDIVFRPWFSSYGFRYVEVQGLNYDIDLADAEAVVLASNLLQTGHFTCSDKRLEQLHSNVVWGARGNFTDIPTDCPTRERMGWTGDIQVFAPASTMLFDVRMFLRRYLRNLAAEQLPSGAIPPYIPSATSAFSGGMHKIAKIMAQSVGWGDVSVMLPWTLYEYYADKEVLRQQYDSMRRWVDYLEARARNHQSWRRWAFGRLGKLEQFILDTGFQWGEWLRASEPIHRTVYQLWMSSPSIATAYLANSSRILSKTCALLENRQESEHYAQLAYQTRNAWRLAFIRENGARIAQDYQDDYVRALAFGFLEPHEISAATNRLVELVEAAGDHLTTGFMSTGLLLSTLSENGRADVAYRVLLQREAPSWLFQVEKGGTTMWESWHGYDSKGRAFLSHNHYAFGSVARWLQEGVAGLSPACPGYRRLRIRPCIGGGLTHASATLITPLGLAKSSWMVDPSTKQVTLEVVVPAGATAEVFLGESNVQHVGAGEFMFTFDV